MIRLVRRALGRTQPLASPPVPPPIDEPITRQVHSELGLPELFARRAQLNHMQADLVYVEDLPERLVEFLRRHHCHRLILPLSPLLDQLQLPSFLKAAGFDVHTQDQIALDELYGFDRSLTDVYCAVAETGSLVIAESPRHSRALSLVPSIHVAIVEPRNCVPDLVDLFQKLQAEAPAQNLVLITGPSKTADIEMTLVTGVHGPAQVQLFVLR